MKFRVYDKKKKQYIPNVWYCSDSDKYCLISHGDWEMHVEILDKANITIELGMASYDGSGRTFYEGDVFAVNILGKYYPYFLKFRKENFCFKALFNNHVSGTAPTHLTPFVHSVQMIGNIHKISDVKKELEKLNVG